MDLGTQVGESMLSGMSMGDAFSDTDYTSVFASTAFGAAYVPGVGKIMKVTATLMEIADGAVDVKKTVAYVGGTGDNNKSLRSAVIDKVPSSIVRKGANKILNNFVKAINEDLGSKAAATLTKQTKTAMRKAKSVLKSQKIKLVSDLGAISLEDLLAKQLMKV